MIDRRQSTRRPGEPPYYPKVCLLVRPENLRTFLTVYPALEALPVPKTAPEPGSRRRRRRHRPRRQLPDEAMIRRRRKVREIEFSFDSFLDVVANVVGIILRLILVAWVGRGRTRPSCRRRGARPHPGRNRRDSRSERSADSPGGTRAPSVGRDTGPPPRTAQRMAEVSPGQHVDRRGAGTFDS